MGCFVGILVWLMTGVIWYFSESILIWCGQDETVSKGAWQYLMGQYVGVGAAVIFESLKRWIQATDITTPIMYSNIFGVAVLGLSAI